jgi:excinuclease ABC subunit C
VPQRGDKRRLVERILATAREGLGRRLADSASQRRLLDGTAAAFGLDAPPDRIEVYDNSHIQGTNAVGAMIVAGPDGLIKNAYRKFTIRGLAKNPPAAAALVVTDRQPVLGAIMGAGEGGSDASTSAIAGEGLSMAAAAGGDDYAMMREVLLRRFARALKEDPERDRGQWPDLVLIDGGQGQLGVAQGALDELGITDVAVIGLAKRLEEVWVPSEPDPIIMPRNSEGLYLLQRVRDEAHRFAITYHRSKRSKRMTASALDSVPGLGEHRRKALVTHFGSIARLKEATVDQITAVPGIGVATANAVLEALRPDPPGAS